MPIGFNPGDLGGGRGDPPSSRPAPVAREQPGLDDVLDEIGRGLWSWVAVLTRTISPVVWTRWTTAADERTCPECAPLDGMVWPDGDGPAPPLHPSCRCARLPAFTEWRTRETTAWELRWAPA
jgi:hypothetical protein